MKYIKYEEFCLPCMLGHGNDGVWIVSMYLQKQTKQDCQVPSTDQFLLFFYFKKIRTYGKPQKHKSYFSITTWFKSNT